MVKVKLKFRRAQFSKLTDSQYALVSPLIEDGRKRKYKLRSVLNAILKITRMGGQWRNSGKKKKLPWETMYYYFRKWSKNGVFSKILEVLTQKERLRQGQNSKASSSAVDSQSVKKGAFVSINSGYDGNKKVNGRKRHLAVDNLGLPLAIFVSAASEGDGTAGLELLWRMDIVTQEMKLVRADHAYRGEFCTSAGYFGCDVEITQKPESQKGFVPQKGRWQVERSFAWLNFFRRLSRDYEKTVESSVAFCQLAFIDIILARLAN